MKIKNFRFYIEIKKQAFFTQLFISITLDIIIFFHPKIKTKI